MYVVSIVHQSGHIVLDQLSFATTPYHYAKQSTCNWHSRCETEVYILATFIVY